MAQHFETLGRYCGAVSWDTAIEIQSVSGEVDKKAKGIVADRSLTADLTPAKKLLGQLTPTDIVLTTNFDTVLERAAANAHRSLSIGLPPVREGRVLRCQHGPDAIRLLKLHGSVDWYLATRRACVGELPQGVDVLYMKVDDNREGHASDTRSGELEHDFCLTRCATADAARELVGDFFPDHRAAMPRFGGTKQPHNLSGLGLLWAAAARDLRDATQLICIGFSFSDQDQLIRLLLANSLRARTSPPSVMLVDPSSCDIARRIGHLLPNPKLVKSPHQDVNWTSVLEDSPV
ncbi:MAG: hypothetical protein DYG92_10675 [Leptolyngbya sp. PLA1]|nr:hypothetical protein [Leptolyngbya sp. PLA1]